MTLLDLPKIIDTEHKIESLWASDAGRNSNSGKFSGTFIGWFDTIHIAVGKTTQAEMTQIRNAIENPIIESVKFIDSKTGNYKTEDFYGTAISAKTNKKDSSMYEPFSFDIKAVNKRGDM